MKSFDSSIVWVFIASVMLMLICAWFEGTLTRGQWRKVNVPFFEHGGMFYACIFLAFASGHIFPLLANNPPPVWNYTLYYGMSTVVSIAVTAALFSFWQPYEWWDNSPAQIKGEGIMLTGCIFFCIMTAFIELLIFGYAFTPAPEKTVWKIFWWLAPWPLLSTAFVNWRVNRGRLRSARADEMCLVGLRYILSELKKSWRVAWIITAGLEVLILILTLGKVGLLHKALWFFYASVILPFVHFFF